MKKWKKGLLSVTAVCKAREDLRRARGERCSQCNTRLQYESVKCHNETCRRRACKKCASFVMQGSYATDHTIERWICSICDEEMVDIEHNEERQHETTMTSSPEISAQAARVSLEAAAAATRCRDSTMTLIHRICDAKSETGKDWMAHYSAVAAVGTWCSSLNHTHSNLI